MLAVLVVVHLVTCCLTMRSLRDNLVDAEYAQVTRMLGNGRLEAFCFDGVNRLCHIRGKLRKRVWIGVGDIILLGLREFQDQKADIILKYDGDEARSLKTYGELPDTVQINAGTEMLEGEEFGDDSKMDATPYQYEC